MKGSRQSNVLQCIKTRYGNLRRIDVSKWIDFVDTIDGVLDDAVGRGNITLNAGSKAARNALKNSVDL